MREKEQKEEWFEKKRREQRAAEVHKLQWQKKRTRSLQFFLSLFRLFPRNLKAKLLSLCEYF